MATLLLVHAHPDDEAISTGGVMLKARAEGHRVVLDRKSTRLNSSHLVISYAVFCLKKKTHLHPVSTPLAYDAPPAISAHTLSELERYDAHAPQQSSYVDSDRSAPRLQARAPNPFVA